MITLKLLIVDDEELTRRGLISALDWKSLGIDEIIQANDGVNGLSMALLHKPDIILCDVRMPRMDGITMLERIESHLPDVCAVFMSGYSDKEYLKAAIQLKAVNYIEKPIEPNEIKNAILHCVERCQKMKLQKTANAAHSNLAARQLAYQLTMPYPSCKESIDALCVHFQEHYGTDKFKSVTTFIIKSELPLQDAADYEKIHQKLCLYLRPMHLHAVYTERRLYHTVYHIYGSSEPSKSTLTVIAEKLHSLFGAYGPHYIAIGESVCGITNVFHSYESAVLLLQNCFFFEPDAILTDSVKKEYAPLDHDRLKTAAERYENSLLQSDETAVITALTELYDSCAHATDFLPNQIKAVYYDLFSSLYRARRSQKLLPDVPPENLLDLMDTCFSFFNLHSMLVDKTEAFISDRKASLPENTTIYMIRDYINRNYAKSDLSVKDISEYVHLSASYTCTFFKNETGATLSQYITEFRMEKAKLLLFDPRFKISDVSAAVGYNDGNYFGKSFRKYTGLSPSEYREKVLKE